MKALARTHKGLEDITALEIKELIDAKNIKQRDCCVLFEAKSYEDLALPCYKAQSISKVLLLFDVFKIKNINDIKEKTKKINLNEWLTEKTTFAVRSKIIENKLESLELEPKVGEFILDKVKAKVNLENPDITFFVYIYKNDCYIGVDLTGVELSKRDYRIYIHPAALKGTLAYALVRIADYKKKETILDPFCGSGTIAVEAALFATGFSLNYYSKDKFAFLKLKQFKDINLEKFDMSEMLRISEHDQEPAVLDKLKKIKTRIYGFDKELRHIVAAKKNAKIAGIEKNIDFSRADIDWLDTKLDKISIDKIITNPPQITRFNEKFIAKLYKEFFYQADFVLKPKGTITLITKNKDLILKPAEEYKFKLIKKEILLLGEIYLK